MRTKLPARRRAITISFTWGDNSEELIATFGLDDKDQVCEIFLRGAKIGSNVSTWIAQQNIILSTLLQYGEPVEAVLRKIAPDAPAVIDQYSKSPVHVALELAVELQQEITAGRNQPAPDADHSG